MANLKFIAVILLAATAGAAAYGQDNGGGLVAPEISKPAPGHLLDQNYLTSTGATVAAARRFAIGRPDAARPRHPAAGQQDRQQHLQRLLRRRGLNGHRRR